MESSTKLKEEKSLGNGDPMESKWGYIQYRYIAALIGFTIFFSLNAYRMNMSVGIVAMVNNSVFDLNNGTKSDSWPDLQMNGTKNFRNDSRREVFLGGGEFDWSPEIQGYILGSYYLSYTIVQIPCGKLVERFGCKWVFFWGLFLAAAGTLFVPVASRLHAYAVVASQLLRGIGQGSFQTSGAVLSANWFPKRERGLFCAFVQSGAPLGSFLGSIFAGLLCKSTYLGGWSSSFYVFGVGGLVIAVVTALFFYESPSVHPKISETELSYILNNQENTLTRRRPKTPWRKICTSVPVYALMIGCFGHLWGISQFLIVHSTYLGTILHYPIEENGYLSAVPFLLMFLFTQVSGSLSIFLTNRKYISVNHMRKFWNFISCLGFSGCLLGVYFAGYDRFWSNVFSCSSMAFIGLGLPGVWIVSTDMTPTFSASVNSISCTFGFLPSFILPLLVGYMTNEMQTIEQWHKVFFITIGIVMSSSVIFSVFGSADVQPWNFVKDAAKEENEKRTQSKIELLTGIELKTENRKKPLI